MSWSWTFGRRLDGYGHVQVFEFMLHTYTRMGISVQEMMALIHLTSFHYNTPNSKGSKPGLKTIAKLMGYSDPSTVSRLLKGLEEKGFLIIHRTPGHPNHYNFARWAERAEQEWVKMLNEREQEGIDPEIKTSLDLEIKPRLDLEINRRRSIEEEKGEEEEVSDDGYAVVVYYKDQARVSPAPGKTRKQGPWFVKCLACDVEVEVTTPEQETECLCGMHSYRVTKTRPDADTSGHHPAVLAHRRATGVRIKPYQAKLIAKAVSEDDLPFWIEVLVAYKKIWSPYSVEEQIEWYLRNEIPKRKGGKRGATRNESETVGETVPAV